MKKTTLGMMIASLRKENGMTQFVRAIPHFSDGLNKEGKVMKLRNIVFVLFLTGMLAALLSGCGAKKYKVDYCGQKSAYSHAKDAYPAGKTVTLYYKYVATDTNYSFYLDGESILYEYDETKGLKIVFTMPDHDVTLKCDSINSSVYME